MPQEGPEVSLATRRSPKDMHLRDVAVSNGQLWVVKEVLKRRVEVTPKTLHLAVEQGSVEAKPSTVSHL